MEDSRKVLNKLRASFRLNSLSNFKKIESVEIPEIPKVRTIFPNTKNDYWYSVDLGADINASACIYEMGIESEFKAHYHNKNVEYLIPLTEGCKIEVVTDKYFKFIDNNESVVFKKKEKHAVVNHSPFVVKILVVWSPKMKGWDAIFNKVKEDIKI